MKVIVDSLSDIPEALRGEYEEKDGKFFLKLEGEPQGYIKASELAEANRKLTEFRDTNIGLKQKHDELTAKLAGFDGIDPEEHKKLKERIAELEKKGVKGGDDVTTIVQKAIADAVTPLQKQLEDLGEREKNAQSALKRKELESSLTQAGLKAGVDEKAMPDYLRRGLEVFKLEDGKPMAKNGDTPLFSKAKPTEPLTIDEWAAGLSADAPHLFRPSKGGGAAPGPGGNEGQRTISNDPLEFGRNLEDIAKGKTVVSPQ